MKDGSMRSVHTTNSSSSSSGSSSSSITHSSSSTLTVLLATILLAPTMEVAPHTITGQGALHAVRCSLAALPRSFRMSAEQRRRIFSDRLDRVTAWLQ